MSKMKCQLCGCEWDIPGSMNLQLDNCPFCNQSLKKREIRIATTLPEALSEISFQFGPETLKDGKKMLGFFADIAPALQKERRIISYFINCGGHSHLYKVRCATKTDQQIALKKVVHKMVEEWYIAEQAAEMVCQAYMDALTPKSSIETNHSLNIASKNNSENTVCVINADDYQKGLAFECGTPVGTGVDYSKAVLWYQKAAEAGNIDAMYRLAVIYEMGPKELQSLINATIWYEKAANLGDTSSQIAMLRISKTDSVIQHWTNILYQKGILVNNRSFHSANNSDLSTNPVHCEQQARLGNPEAQYQLGLMHEKGLNGLKPDLKKAIEWFEMAAQSKHPKAQLRLAEFYEFGNGVPQNRVTARSYYKLAADQTSDRETAETAKIRLSLIDAQTHSIVKTFHVN